MKKKIASLLLTLALGLVLTVPAFAANYSKWTATEFSGQTDFGYFYTYAGQDQSTYPYQDALETHFHATPGRSQTTRRGSQFCQDNPAAE